jgi:hypothetical protein
MTVLTKEIKDQFLVLANQLSPENLCCDGEAPMSYVRKRRSQLMKEWSRLERLLGRTVTENEAYSWYLE